MIQAEIVVKRGIVCQLKYIALQSVYNTFYIYGCFWINRNALIAKIALCEDSDISCPLWFFLRSVTLPEFLCYFQNILRIVAPPFCRIGGFIYAQVDYFPHIVQKALLCLGIFIFLRYCVGLNQGTHTITAETVLQLHLS